MAVTTPTDLSDMDFSSLEVILRAFSSTVSDLRPILDPEEAFKVG